MFPVFLTSVNVVARYKSNKSVAIGLKGFWCQIGLQGNYVLMPHFPLKQCYHSVVDIMSQFSLYSGYHGILYNTLNEAICPKLHRASSSVTDINALGPSDAIWRWRSWPTLIQVMACCLTAASHHLNRCWINTNMVQWQTPKGYFTINTSDINY